MMNTKNKTLSSILALTLAGSTFAFADGQDVQLADCPAEVSATIEKNLAEGKIDEIELIEIDDKKMYIADIDLADGRDLTLYVNADGKLFKTSEDVVQNSLPAAVSDALRFRSMNSIASRLTRALFCATGLLFLLSGLSISIKSDAILMNAILQNVIGNAAAHAPRETPIFLELNANFLTVRNASPGLQNADLPRLFGRFWQNKNLSNYSLHTPVWGSPSSRPARIY